MRRIKQYKNGKFGLWSTISDGYLHEPRELTREEMIEFMVMDWQEKLEEQIKELKENFPKGWVDKDTNKII